MLFIKKIKVKLFLIISLVLFVNSNYSQEQIGDNTICIKVAPLALFDIYSGMSPRLGFEYKVFRNIAFYNEFGTYIPNANGMYNNRGYLTKFECKIYLNRLRATIGHYFSAEFFYKHQSYYTYDTILNNNFNYLKNYSVNKKVSCYTVKYGFLHAWKGRILLDYFIGFGIRQKNITSSLSNYENENIKPEGNYNENILKNKAGIFQIKNFDAGIKIAFSLNN